MRRLLLVLCGLALGFPAHAGAAPAGSVKLLDCGSGPKPEDRSATFEARARAVRGSERMQIRFGLQVREDAREGWRRVVAPGVDEWLRSDPGVRRYAFARTFRNLAAPASYRAVVRFRWLDGDGSVVAGARGVSPACRQPDLRPDLAATAVAAAPAEDPGSGRYVATVRNRGRSAAGAFSVGLRVAGTELPPLAVPGLEPGASHVLSFAGPPCAPGAPLAVSVDAGNAVAERDEDDNVLEASCAP